MCRRGTPRGCPLCEPTNQERCGYLNLGAAESQQQGDRKGRPYLDATHHFIFILNQHKKQSGGRGAHMRANQVSLYCFVPQIWDKNFREITVADAGLLLPFRCGAAVCAGQKMDQEGEAGGSRCMHLAC